MGLRPGEQLERLCVIRVLDVRIEPLRRLTDDLVYGFAELVLEGFRDHPELCWPSEFVKWFCRSHKGCTPETEITRIYFDYEDAGVLV